MPAAVAQEFLAVGEPAQYQGAVGRPLAFPDDIGFLVECLAGERQLEQRVAVFGVQFDMLRPSSNQGRKRMYIAHRMPVQRKITHRVANLPRT